MFARAHLPRAAGAIAIIAALATPWGTPAVAAGTGTATHSILTSTSLWSTIDICDPHDKPNVVGVIGSMPGDGVASDRLYMSVRLQYLDSTSNTWSNVVKGVDQEYTAVGSGAARRQDGWSFQLVPSAHAFTVRAIVDFQWRHGKRVLEHAARITTASHTSTSYAADPSGYSAASCTIS